MESHILHNLKAWQLDKASFGYGYCMYRENEFILDAKTKLFNGISLHKYSHAFFNVQHIFSFANLTQDNINQDINFSKKQASLCNKHVKWIKQIFFSQNFFPICGIKYS
jgi:hypothetical protein